MSTCHIPYSVFIVKIAKIAYIHDFNILAAQSAEDACIYSTY